MHFNESHPEGMNHGPGVLIGKNVTLFLCTSWSWLMYCQFCPRRICMQRNASTIRGWGGGGGGGHFKGFGGSNSSSSPSMTFHSSFNLLYMSLLLMTARPSLCLMDCNRPTTATTQSWLNDKTCQSLSESGQGKNCEIINWITKAESPRRQELDNCKIHNWLSARWMLLLYTACHAVVVVVIVVVDWWLICPSVQRASTAAILIHLHDCLLWSMSWAVIWSGAVRNLRRKLIYFRHVWLTAVNLANQNK